MNPRGHKVKPYLERRQTAAAVVALGTSKRETEKGNTVVE